MHDSPQDPLRSQPSTPLAGLVICMVGPHEPRPGGVTTQVETLSRCLRSDGVDVRPVDTNIQALRRLERLGRWLLPLGQLVVVPWRLWRASRDADLIHAHLASFWGFYLPMLAIGLVRRLRHLPVVASYHGGMAGQFIAAHRSRVQSLLGNVDVLLTSAQAIAAAFEPLGLQPILMPNVVDLAQFSPRPGGPRDLADQPAPLLLWIKRFDAVSNPALMVRAYALIRQQVPAARLMMIGDGPRRAEVETLAAALDAPVEFAGRVSFEALQIAYAAADLFVSSSVVDNQPNTLLEASALGLPIVATAVGGVPEMVHDGVDALLAPPDDPIALAQAILRILREPELAERLSQAAIANAQRFTWPAVRPQMAAVYGEVFGRLVDWCVLNGVGAPIYQSTNLPIRKNQPMSKNPPTALITGIAGFCGSYLAELLVGHGWRVVGLDVAADAGERLRRLGLDVVVHQSDLADAQVLQAIISDVQPVQVYHLAALTNPAAPYRALYEVNVYGTIHLLEALRHEAPDAAILIAGSSAQYGPTQPHENPIDETQEFRPITQYAVTKATQDLLGYMAGAAGQQVVRTRSFNIIGPRQGPQFVSAAFARQIAQIEQGFRPPVIEVGNLAAVRDFVDVRDVVRAYMLALAAGRPGQAYNVCSGAGRSVQSLMDGLLALSTTQSIEVRPMAERMQPADVPAQFGSCARLAAAAGWQPLIPWQQTLRELLDYWRAAVAGDR